MLHRVSQSHTTPKMGHITLSLLVAICFIGASYGITDCSNGDEALLNRMAKFCPNTLLLNTPDETYCCEGGCCTLLKYSTSGYRLIILMVVAGVLLVSLISCCCICICRTSCARGR